MLLPNPHADLAARDTYQPSSDAFTVRIVNICAALGFLATVFFFARVYSRAYVRRIWMLDDWFLAIGWFLDIGRTILVCIMTSFSTGSHAMKMTPAQRRFVFYDNRVNRALWMAVLFFIKLSICVFYLHLFKAEKWMTWALRGCTLFLILAWLPIQILVVTIRTRTASMAIFYTYGPANIVSDALLIAVVCPRVLRMQMAPRLKAAVLLVASMGVLAITAAIIRTVQMSAVLNGVKASTSWTSFEVEIWLATEITVTMFCACAPSCRPLLRKLGFSRDESEGGDADEAGKNVNMCDSSANPSVPKPQRQPQDEDNLMHSTVSSTRTTTTDSTITTTTTSTVTAAASTEKDPIPLRRKNSVGVSHPFTVETTGAKGTYMSRGG